MKTSHLLLCLFLGLSASIPALSPPASAQRLARSEWKSKSGDLVLYVVDRWGRSCAAGTAQATYRVKGGSDGLIYPDDCADNSGLARFEDTSGAERCVGAMRFDIVQSGSSVFANSTWVIKGAAPGFRCSTAGQTFKVKLFPVYIRE